MTELLRVWLEDEAFQPGGSDREAIGEVLDRLHEATVHQIAEALGKKDNYVRPILHRYLQEFEPTGEILAGGQKLWRRRSKRTLMAEALHVTDPVTPLINEDVTTGVTEA